MLGRKKTPQAPAPTTVVERPGAKNRPTPKRAQAQAQRRRPLVPTDRKAAAKADREKVRADRLRQREALASGDDSHLPPRDAGPKKRFVRDVVDGRLNLGEFYLYLALLAVALVVVPSLVGLNDVQVAQVQLVSTLVLWGTVLVVGTDAFVLARRLKAALRARFGDDVVLRGLVSYGVLRSFQIRRLRLPKPAVARRQPPR